MIRIKPASKTDAVILRRYGHRIFVEVDDKLQHLGFYIEFRDGSEVQTQPVTSRKTRTFARSPLAKNVALIWVDRPIQYKPESVAYKIADVVKQVTSGKATRRMDLTAFVTSILTEVSPTTISPAISDLYDKGYLRVAGDE